MTKPKDEKKQMVTEGADFIRAMVAADVAAGKHGGRVATRFPPEPNGYLHIGHAKSICLNFGVAEEFGGICNLRFDDTNPETEDPEYVAAIERDVHWLGFDWHELRHASDYFEQLYAWAVLLIEKGKAYVDTASEEEIRACRGTITEPGTPTPDRDRPAAESLDLFARMRAGELPDGAAVLRAKIDLAATNMLMRDPILYRIRHAEHYRAGKWNVYPMYDFAHCLSDAIEGITHSLCTLEFENNRELYDWIIREVGIEDPPEQTEFARLNLPYTVMSKRRLLRLVEGGHVAGWDDPRMPTLSAFRRRGYTPEAIRTFCDRVGVAKSRNVIELALLEHTIRDDLNHEAPRVLGVLRPLRVVIESWPEGESETIDAPSWPHDVPKEGSRPLPFGRELLIERDDFREDPPPGYHRLAPGREVRLRWGYVIRCVGVDKDKETGEITAVRCTHDPATRGGAAPEGRKVQGTIHWVSAAHALPVELRLYDRLFLAPEPGANASEVDAAGDGESEERDFLDDLNPDSLEVLEGRIEPSVADAEPGDHFQLERQGYFTVDPDSRPGRLVLNRTVTLRDTWAKVSGEDRSRAAEAEARAAAKAAHKAAQRAAAEAKAEPARALEPAQLAVAAGLRKVYELGEPEAALLASDDDLRIFFELAVDAAVEPPAGPRAVANWLLNELRGRLDERALDDLPFDAAAFAELVSLVEGETITGTAGKEVLDEMVERGGTPAAIVARRGLEQIADPDALRPTIEAVLAEHGEQVAAYRAGKTALLGFFVGQVMRRTGGKADPQLVQRLLRDALG